MEPARGPTEKASPSPSSSSGLFRRRLGTNGSGFCAAFVVAAAAAAQLACVLAVLFCVTSVTSIRSRCHASKATGGSREAKATSTNDAERAAPIFKSLGLGEIIADYGVIFPTARTKSMPFPFHMALNGFTN